jgi:hypothetical protein
MFPDISAIGIIEESLKGEQNFLFFKAIKIIPIGILVIIVAAFILYDLYIIFSKKGKLCCFKKSLANKIHADID